MDRRQKFKGAGFNTLVKVVRDLYGDDGLKKVMKGASPKLKA